MDRPTVLAADSRALIRTYNANRSPARHSGRTMVWRRVATPQHSCHRASFRAGCNRHSALDRQNQWRIQRRVLGFDDAPGDQIVAVTLRARLKHDCVLKETATPAPVGAGVATGSGGGIRTPDLWVMSPTSCRCSTPRRAMDVRLGAMSSEPLTDFRLPTPYEGGGCPRRPRLPWGRPHSTLRRCAGSRPGSGWDRVGPARSRPRAPPTPGAQPGDRESWDPPSPRASPLLAGRPRALHST